VDVTDENEIEQTNIKATRKKYRASVHTPFMQHLLLNNFWLFKAGMAKKDGLIGSCNVPVLVPEDLQARVYVQPDNENIG
jgi:hypothetical protein